MPTRYTRRARATTASASPAPQKNATARRPLVALAGGAIVAPNPRKPLPKGARLLSDVRDDKDATRARDEAFLELVRKEVANGPRLDDSMGLLDSPGAASLEDLFLERGVELTSRSAASIREDLVRACAALRHMHDYAGRAQIPHRCLGAINRGGLEREFIWCETLRGAHLLFAGGSQHPVADFGLPAKCMAELVDAIEHATSGPRPTSLDRWDIAAVDITTADGALFIGGGACSAIGCLRVDWDDVPALLTILRQARDLAAAWAAREVV